MIFTRLLESTSLDQREIEWNDSIYDMTRLTQIERDTLS